MVILDLILTPSDSSVISNVTVSDLVLDHALVKFHPGFACPVVRKVDSISFRSSAYFILKGCMDILFSSITKHDNLSLAEGVFPQKVKKVVVTPLIKKASLPSEDMKN